MKEQKRKAEQTALEAIAEARLTKTIAVTETTLDLIEKLARFNEASEQVMDVIIDNMPDTMNDVETINTVHDRFFMLQRPATDHLYETAGKMIFHEMFSIAYFQGL